MDAHQLGRECPSPVLSVALSVFYSKARKYLGTLENTNLTLLARFPNLATLESVNLIVSFTIIIPCG